MKPFQFSGQCLAGIGLLQHEASAAEIQGGQVAVNIINTLRDRWSLPNFSSTVEIEIQDMVVAERQRELWMEGFRAYDIRRLSLPLFPTTGTDYQPGIKGGTYGDQICIPIPIVETFNNETIRGGDGGPQGPDLSLRS